MVGAISRNPSPSALTFALAVELVSDRHAAAATECSRLLEAQAKATHLLRDLRRAAARRTGAFGSMVPHSQRDDRHW